MTKKLTGGTEMYCPFCKTYSSCKSKSYSSQQFGESSRQESGGVHYFARVRVCSNCGVNFETAEVEESVINELLTLRKLVSSVKEQIHNETDQYLREHHTRVPKE